jgi:hypothetical protein
MTQDEVVDMKDFNEWWDSDIPITSPFRRGSPAYWAWAGWQAALREQAMIEVQRLGQEIEATQPVAWISTTELLVMRGNAYAGAKDWRVNLGLEPEEGDVGLYTSPPQRTWITLTDGEFLKACQLAEDGNYLVAFQRIQQWLKEKNK